MTTDPRQARQARFAVSVVFAVCGAAFSTWAARVPAVQEKLGLSAGQLAVGLFGLAAGAVVALLGAGPFLTTFGSRVGVAAGVSVLCAGLPLVAFAPGLPWFVAALAVLGFGNSLLDVSMNAHAARVEQEYGRPIFAGFHAFWNVGGLAGSGAGALMAVWRVPIAVHFSVAGAVLFLAGAWAVATRFLGGADQGQGESAFALPGRVLLPLGVIAFCGFFAEGTVNDWSAVYLKEVTAASAALASLGYFAFSIAMIGVRTVTDRVVVRVGAVRFVRVATAVAVGGFVLLVAVPLAGVGIAAFAVVGLGVAGIVPVAWSAAGQKQPDSPGKALAAVAACGYLGFLICPVIVGALTNLIGLHLALGAAGLLTASIYFVAPALRVSASRVSS
jgi:MFS family permease